MQTFVNPLPGVPDIESPFFGQIFAQKQLDAETMDLALQMRRQGFAVLRFPETAFDALAEQLIAELDGTIDGRVQDAWQQNTHVRRIATNARLLAILQALYGRRPIPFQTLNFDRGTEQPTHSDIVHFSSMPERFMCGVWVALEDIDEHNGPLRYYPGTHAWPAYYNDNLGAFVAGMTEMQNYPAYERLWQALIDAAGAEEHVLLGKRGTTLIWSANLLHGGAPQRDPRRTRHSQVTHYYFENCSYYTPLHSDLAYGNIFYRHVIDICTGKPVDSVCCGHAVSRRHLDRSLDYGIHRHGSLSLRKFVAPQAGGQPT